MSTTVLIILAGVVVLIAQAATIYVVRRMVRRWCTGVFQHGYKSGIEASEPFAEAYRIGYDTGYERAYKDGEEEYGPKDGDK